MIEYLSEYDVQWFVCKGIHTGESQPLEAFETKIPIYLFKSSSFDSFLFLVCLTSLIFVYVTTSFFSRNTWGKILRKYENLLYNFKTLNSKISANHYVELLLIVTKVF